MSDVDIDVRSDGETYADVMVNGKQVCSIDLRQRDGDAVTVRVMDGAGSERVADEIIVDI